MRLALFLFVILVTTAFSQEESASNGNARQEPAEVKLVEGWNGDQADASGRPSRRWRGKRQGPDVGIRMRFDRPVTVWDLKGAFSLEGGVPLWDEMWQETKDTVRVPAQLKPGGTYVVEFVDTGSKPGVQKINQGKHTFTVPGGPPTLRFTQLGGRLIERKSRQLMHLVIRNTEQIRFEATNVPLHALISGAPSLPTSGAIDDVTDSWAKRLGELKGTATGPFAGLFDDKVVTEKEVFSEPGPRDRERRASLPLAWRLAKNGRALLVRAVSLDKGDAGETSLELVQITDLALSWKTSASELIVWATKLSDGQVAPKARVFLCTDAGVLIAAGETDADGVLKIAQDESKPSLDVKGGGAPATTAVQLGSVKRLFVVTDEDATFADVEENLVTIPSKIDTTEKPQVLTRAHAFTERGVYRPGDLVRYKATLRTFKDGQPSVPDGAGSQKEACVISVTDPKGKKTQETKLPLTDFGTVAGTIRTRAADPLGQYTLEVRSLDGKTLWGSANYRVEEFVPPRHKVEVAFQEKEITVDEGVGGQKKRRVVQAEVKGVYYAGGPVKHGKVRWRVELEGTRHELAEKGYVAGTDLPGDANLLESGEAVLDAKGGVGIEVPLSAEVLDGRRSLAVSATVLDFDARAASGSGKFAVKPPVLVGISAHTDAVDSGDTIDLTAIVVGKDGKRVASGDVTIAVLEEQWNSVQKRNDDGDFYWTSEAMMVKAYESSAKLEGGVAPVRVTFNRGGKHQVQVAYKDGDTTYKSATTVEVNWGDSEAEGDNWNAEKLRRVSLALDRTEYVPGETAKVRIVTPRAAASMLLTVEREKVILTKRVSLKAGENVVEIPVDASWAPNVYVSLIATHPREAFPLYAAEADTQAPGYSVGFASLPVRPEHTRLAVTLTGAGPAVSARPGAQHKVSVAVKDKDGKPVQGEVALAVVDESVLSLTDFQTPTLSELFRVLFPLAVKTGDIRLALALQTPFKSFAVRPLTGGDGGEGRSRPREWFDPVAFFQPDLLTDANGEATVEFTLPDTMTTYRVYALAIDKGARHGSAAQPLLVRKPFYLEAGMPRFFTAGDKGAFSVAVFNGTGAAGEVELSVTAAGGLTVEVPQAKQQLAANDRTRFPVKFEATAPTHTKLEFRAKMGSNEDAVVLAVPVRSRYIPRTMAQDGATATAETESTVNIAVPADAAALPPDVAREATARVEVSSLASLRLVGGLRHLLQYPYGCIEQTSSGVLPLAALREMIDKKLLPQISKEEADRFLRPGIDRLLSMQTAKGGFGYWPGDTTEHPWGSAYATYALAQAKRAGANVPEADLKRALDYLTALAGGKSADRNQIEGPDPIALRTARPIAHWVLASEGRALEPAREMRAEPNLSREHALFYAMAMARAGQAAEAKKELARVTAKPFVPGVFDPWTFYTPVRSRALELLATIEIDPKSAKTTTLMAELYRALQPDGSWLSTQDNAWCVTALGRMQALATPPGAQFKGAVAAPGQAESAFTLEGTTSPTHTAVLDGAKFLAGPSVKITKDAGAPLFYRVETTFPWRGPDADSGDAVIKREYKRLAGEGPIRVGDLVEVTISGSFPVARHYIALSDPLPAGLVAVNSALKNEGKLPSKRPEDEDGWYTGGEWIWALTPDHLELRDDRVVAFKNHAWSSKFRFTYAARAVCEGTFAVPPVKAEPMYQPETAMFSAEGSLKIEPAGQ